MRTTRTAAVLFACLTSGLLASPAFADEPTKPAPSAPAPTQDTTAPAPNGNGTSPAAPTTTQTPASAPAPTAPQGYTPAPAAPPQGAYPQGAYPQAPQGAYPQGAYPQGAYPPPAYGPRGYYPPGYYPYPVYRTPARIDGAKAEDYKLDKTAAVSEDNAGEAPDADHVPTKKEKRRNSRILLGVGGGLLGAGWLASVLHGLIGNLSSVSCNSGEFGFPEGCSQHSQFTLIYVPVVGPVLEAVTHTSPLTSSDAMGFVLETALQVGGIAIMGYGVASRPTSSAAAQTPAFTLAVAPKITDRSASLGVAGTF